MRAWIRYNWKYKRRWMVIAITLSLAGALVAWLLGHAEFSFYSTTPYQPKDEERRLHLERQERAPQGEEQPGPSR